MTGAPGTVVRPGPVSVLSMGLLRCLFMLLGLMSRLRSRFCRLFALFLSGCGPRLERLGRRHRHLRHQNHHKYPVFDVSRVEQAGVDNATRKAANASVDWPNILYGLDRRSRGRDWIEVGRPSRWIACRCAQGSRPPLSLADVRNAPGASRQFDRT